MTLTQLANVALLVFSVIATVMVARQPSGWRLDWRRRLPWFDYSRNKLILIGVAGMVGGVIGIVRSSGFSL